MHFKFIEDIYSYKPDDSFLAIIDPTVKTKEELLKELYNKLKFPGYFGFNWDALFDCLSDFHWMKDKGIILIHTVIPHIEEETLKTYLEILDKAVQDWKEEDEHYLVVVFPTSSEYALKSVINS